MSHIQVSHPVRFFSFVLNVVMQFILSNTIFILLKHFLFLNCQSFSLYRYVELGNLHLVNHTRGDVK